MNESFKSWYRTVIYEYQVYQVIHQVTVYIIIGTQQHINILYMTTDTVIQYTVNWAEVKKVLM